MPWFWPFEFAAAVGQQEMSLFKRGLETVAEAEKLEYGLTPEFATRNTVALELRTMRLRDFSGRPAAGGTPTIIDAPFAGHTAVIADFTDSQSLVRTLQQNGVERVFVTDWKSATIDMKDFDIDNYLADINVAVDDLGGRVNLIGLCQGGWMSAMYAARFPAKVRTLVLAGSPMDTDAGDGAIKAIAHELPISDYEELVSLGGGLMRGRFMLEAWKNMHPGEQYFTKYIDLYEHAEDPAYLKKQESFEAWYENPIDLPGRWYLQAVKSLFKENQLAKGTFVGLGRKLSLKDIVCPVYLLAGDRDDITTKEQVFEAEKYFGTPRSQIVKKLAPGGHIGLFMGAGTLKNYWPAIASWILDSSD
ncbi:MAG: alpha/beta fold hydrolase [Hyphomicrobiaceae bacterium]